MVAPRTIWIRLRGRQLYQQDRYARSVAIWWNIPESARIHYGDACGGGARSDRRLGGGRPRAGRRGRRRRRPRRARRALRRRARARAATSRSAPDTLFALASLTKPLVAAACMVALEEGLLDLDAEVRDGFTLRHLLSHCAGPARGGPALAGAAGVRAGHAALVLERGLRPGGPAARGGVRHVVRVLPARGGACPARHGRLARAGRGRRPAHRARLAAGPLRRGRALQLRALPPRRAAAGRRLRDAPGRTARSSRACSRAAPPPAARCSRPRPSTRCWRRSSGRCRAASTAWASGPTSAGASASTCAVRREPHWAGAALSPRAASHFGASGTLAWLDPELGLGLVALANRGTLLRLVARAVGRARRRGDGCGRSGVDPAMKRIRTRPGAGPEAFDELVEAHLGDVHRYLVYLTGDRALAEDLTADAFERAWKAARPLRSAARGSAQLAARDRPLVRTRPSARRAPARRPRAARRPARARPRRRGRRGPVRRLLGRARDRPRPAQRRRP